MLFVLPALAASVAYSSDVIYARMALEEMSLYMFVFILCVCYAVVGITMLIFKFKDIKSYVTNVKNNKKEISC